MRPYKKKKTVRRVLRIWVNSASHTLCAGNHADLLFTLYHLDGQQPGVWNRSVLINNKLP